MATTKRPPGSHGPSPLSVATRRRLLAGLMDRANAGDVIAAEALVRLSLAAEQARNGTASTTAEAA
jgi:hypothetical protein